MIAAAAAAAERFAVSEQALHTVESAAQSPRVESESLSRQLERARAAGQSATKGKWVAETRIAELEDAIDVAGQEQDHVRERAESRLDALRCAFEQEEGESGAQVKRIEKILKMLNRAFGAHIRIVVLLPLKEIL